MKIRKIILTINRNDRKDWFIVRPMRLLFGVGCPKFGIWLNLFRIK